MHSNVHLSLAASIGHLPGLGSSNAEVTRRPQYHWLPLEAVAKSRIYLISVCKSPHAFSLHRLPQ